MQIVLTIVSGVITVLCCLWDMVRAAGKYAWNLHRYTKTVIIALLVICVIVAFGLQIKHQIRNSTHWKYWTQVVTGNWSSDQPTKGKPAQDSTYLSDDEYIYGVFLATLLNWANIALIFTALWRIYQLERSLKMNISKAFSVKTATEIASVLAVIPDEETRKRVSIAFSDAQKEWQEHLIRMIGKPQADKFFSAMEQEIS